MTTRQIGRDTARLFLARRHLLAPPRSLPAGRESVLAVFERLGSIQFDPLEIAGRNHDLVLLARVYGYRREVTDSLLYDERRLFEAYNKGLSLLPVQELPWHRLTWDVDRERHERDTFAQHAALVDELLDRIRREGPLGVIEFGAREAIDWYWRPTNRVRAILEALAEAGILGFAHRRGNRRYYDLVERLYPASLLEHRPDAREQRLHRLLSRYRGHGLLGRTGAPELWNGATPSTVTGRTDGRLRAELLAALVERGELVPVAVDGVRGDRFVLRDEVGILDEAERDAARASDAGSRTPLDPARAGVALIAPLDPLAWDRDFLRALYGFDYRWEVYIPARRRRWGYYVLPLFWGDRFVGRIEPQIDRAADAVRIRSVYWERGFEPDAHPAFLRDLADALEAHRRFAGVGRVLLSRATNDRRENRLNDLRPILAQHLPSLGRRVRRPRAGRGTPPGPRRAGMGR